MSTRELVSLCNGNSSSYFANSDLELGPHKRRKTSKYQVSDSTAGSRFSDEASRLANQRPEEQSATILGCEHTELHSISGNHNSRIAVTRVFDKEHDGESSDFSLSDLPDDPDVQLLSPPSTEPSEPISERQGSPSTAPKTEGKRARARRIIRRREGVHKSATSSPARPLHLPKVSKRKTTKSSANKSLNEAGKLSLQSGQKDSLIVKLRFPHRALQALSSSNSTGTDIIGGEIERDQRTNEPSDNRKNQTCGGTSVANTGKNGELIRSSEALPAASPGIIREQFDEHLPTAVIDASFILHDQAFQARNTPRDQKPPSVGDPEVHATERQALCETLPYFNAHNGGCCMKDGTIYGFMFDKGANARDLTSTNVLIARAGGGMESVDGELRLRGDQETTNQVLAFQQNIDQCTPIPIIIGGNNPTVQCRLKHAYNVTDLWKPTDLWHEKEPKTGHTMIRYRFEIFDEEKDVWWAVEGAKDQLKLGQLGEVHKEMCTECGKASKQVYINGWMCVQSTACEAYWKFKDGSEPIQAHLRYDARFLLQKTDWPFLDANIPIIPPLMEPCKMMGATYSKQATKGVVCRQCGLCNQRLYFSKWRCESCGWTYQLPKEIIPASALIPPNMTFSGSYDPCRDVLHPSVTRLKPMFRHGYRVCVYIIPGIDGWVAHAIPNESVIKLPGGPNECFECLQTTDINLKRRLMPQKGVGEHRMSSFTRNYGQYYKFIADTETTSRIQDAPMPIRLSAKRMNWVTNLVIDEVNQQLGTSTEHEKFNEMLALAYMERQGINFHDDGEELVGPTIATESFGSNGNMILRMKEKYQKGYSGRGLLTDDTVGGALFKPIPFCKAYERRLAVYENDLVKLEGSALVERKAKLVEEIKRLEKQAKKSKSRKTGNDHADEAVVDQEIKHFRSAKGPIEMKLRHGDITIMHGVGMQRYYEHAVFHEDGLRFALTCRDMERNPSLGDPPYEIMEDTVEWDGWKVPT